MPEVSIEVAGRVYRVGCGEGEEGHLIKLAELIDTEATRLTRKMGQMTEGRLMLMSALMLADKLAEDGGGVDEELQLKLAESQTAALEFEAKAAENEARAVEAEAKLAKAEEVADAGRAEVTALEERAKNAEAQMADAAELAEKAEARAAEAEGHLEEAKSHVAKADARAAEAEAKMTRAEQRAANAEKLAQTPAQPTDLFNPEREEEIAQSLDALAERIETLAGREEGTA